jgi:dienelactone hydrolase
VYSADTLEPLNRFPRMVHEYYVHKVRQAIRENRELKESLKTQQDALQYVQTVREKITESFGPHPEKTPLNPRITKTVERDEYTIENVIFESRPGFLVTANLYIPKNRKFPLPGIVGTCGHSTNGKASSYYQSFSQGLARMGYVVLIYDPIGQGERLQYPDENLKSKIGVGVREHLHAGNQQFLVNEFIGMWRAWDGIRALDYLLTREEVDHNHLGVTGNSGGGTMTTWLCGVESRWTMAAPSCFVTSLKNNMENELPADTEQCPPKALALGLDHEDFIAAMAPKPVILLGKEKDFFDVRGLEGAYSRLKKIYGLLGAEENIQLFVGPTTHGYSIENREAMYRFFNRATKISDAKTEPKLTIENDETLWCTPNGQVCELNSKTVFTFTKAKSKQLQKLRKSLQGEKLNQRIRKILQIPKNIKTPYCRILRSVSNRKQFKRYLLTYVLETEPRSQAIVYHLTEERLLSRPLYDTDEAWLYVSHHSSDQELRENKFIQKTYETKPDRPFFSCDVRGVGDSLPGTCNQHFLNPYGPDYFYAIHSLMLNQPYLGRKTLDVLSTLEWLKKYGFTKIHLISMKWGTIPSLFASVLSDNIATITFYDSLDSFSEIAETEYYQWPLSYMAPNILSEFDLPDCYNELKRRNISVINV